MLGVLNKNLFSPKLIGSIQTNKTRKIAENFHWVHSVSREKIAQRLSEQRPAHLPDLNVCIEVNIDADRNKSGVAVNELKNHGAKNIVVACSHPIMSGPAWERMSGLRAQAEKDGWQFDFVGTSPVEHANTPHWYHTFRIEKLLATIIQKINSRGSVTKVHQDRE